MAQTRSVLAFLYSEYKYTDQKGIGNLDSVIQRFGQDLHSGLSGRLSWVADISKDLAPDV